MMNSRTIRRRAFTLVELMIVIAIIGVLIAMLIVAASKVWSGANKVKLTNEIRQLATAMENFKTRFGAYPPSRIILCEQYSDYFIGGDPSKPISPLHADSLAFINKMFRLPVIQVSPPTGPWIWNIPVPPPALGPAQWYGIDWNGSGVNRADGAGAGPDAPVLLEGDQCLVFFLGGIPSGQTGTALCNGFSTNAQNPAYHMFVPSDAIAPFFDFQSNRLFSTGNPAVPPNVVWKTGSPYPGSPPIRAPFHFSYFDTYGQTPYVYFSTFQSRNGYNWYADLLRVAANPALFSSDGTGLNVWPYAETVTTAGTIQYLNPNSFQIISAGPNGIFGRGSDLNSYASVPPSLWTKANAGNVLGSSASWDYSPMPPPGSANDPKAGLDDQSNFYGSELGVPGGN